MTSELGPDPVLGGWIPIWFFSPRSDPDPDPRPIGGATRHIFRLRGSLLSSQLVPIYA